MTDSGQRDTSNDEDKKGIDEKEGMSSTARIWIELAPLMAIGWVFVFSMGAFLALGWWLDQKLGTGSKLTITGSLIGMAVGFTYLFKVVVDLGKRKTK